MINGEQMVKVEKYRVLNTMVKEGQILFTGSSLMEQFPINELQMDFGIKEIIYNRGIGGFTTADMLMLFSLHKSSKYFVLSDILLRFISKSGYFFVVSISFPPII